MKCLENFRLVQMIHEHLKKKTFEKIFSGGGFFFDWAIFNLPLNFNGEIFDFLDNSPLKFKGKLEIRCWKNPPPKKRFFICFWYVHVSLELTWNLQGLMTSQSLDAGLGTGALKIKPISFPRGLQSWSQECVFTWNIYFRIRDLLVLSIQ